MISKLKQERIAQELSVEDISNQLNIRRKYIVALEEERLDEIPGSVYVNGYIKMYCNYLKVPYSDIEYLTQDNKGEQNMTEPLFKNVSSRNRLWVAIFLILLLTGMSWFYLSREVRHRSILLMEHLENAEPKNYLSNSTNLQIINPVLKDENINEPEDDIDI